MVIIMILSVLLVIIIMAQNPKGGGLSGTFGGNSSAQFGVQRTNDFMEKSTWILASTICGLIILSIVTTAKPSTTVNAAPVQKTVPAPKQSAPQTAPVQNAPVAPVTPVTPTK